MIRNHHTQMACIKIVIIPDCRVVPVVLVLVHQVCSAWQSGF